MSIHKHTSRETAFFILKEIILNQHSLGDAEEAGLENLNHSERAWVKAFVYGFLRSFFSLERLAKTYLIHGLKNKDQDVFLILFMGLYEIRHMGTAKHAAVFETVGLLDLIKKPWAKGLINACLRRDLREIPRLENLYGPAWWEKLIKKYYSENYLSILKNSQEQAPIFLRINTQKISPEDYLKQLENLNIPVTQISNQYLQLNSAGDIRALPGFSEGYFYVQDISLQHVPELLKLSPGLKVLDACSAPGGKALHLLEAQPDLELICLDADLNRLKKLEENFSRFKQTPRIICADATEVEFSQKFDRILLDAPCSATGVVRRHPDILLLRREADLLELAQIQLKILNHLSQYLKHNGYLLYTTCSILELENDGVIKKFLKQNANWTSESFVLPVGKKTYLGWQILPGESPEQNGDGFYYCLLKRELRLD